MSDRHVRRGTDDYADALADLLPTGPAWPREPTSLLMRFLRGLADLWGDAGVDASAARLLEQESDPRLTFDLLPDWEGAFGLPDPCTGPLPTLAARRAALVAKMTTEGGQSRAFFIALAASIGFTITITEFRPFRAGIGRASDRVYGVDWAYAWQVNAPSVTVTLFRSGQSGAGERLATWGNLELECVIRRYAPAHTILIFAYS
jgi:uncharacterized protein YmfQ (DUF2313 family)